jgi:hypothetical protein
VLEALQRISWLRDGRSKGRSSSPGRVKNFRFSISRSPVGSTQPPIHCVTAGFFSLRVKPPGREADRSPPNSVRSRKRGSI